MKAAFNNLLARLPAPPGPGYPEGTPFVAALTHGSLRVELYAPGSNADGRDRQQPHAQDELYVVQRGTSDFWRDGSTVAVQAGDILFVPAGVAHRFENFSPDFVTWVVFYGPSAGEKP